jgi:hypothetical protein
LSIHVELRCTRQTTHCYAQNALFEAAQSGFGVAFWQLLVLFDAALGSKGSALNRCQFEKAVNIVRFLVCIRVLKENHSYFGYVQAQSTIQITFTRQNSVRLLPALSGKGDVDVVRIAQHRHHKKCTTLPKDKTAYKRR